MREGIGGSEFAGRGGMIDDGELTGSKRGLSVGSSHSERGQHGSENGGSHIGKLVV